MEEINVLISKYEWKFSKNLAKTPHWYIVRGEVNENDYIKLYNYIKTHYVEERFYNKIFRYCYIGEYKYWIMSDDISKSKIINRCKKEVNYGNN